MGSCAPRSPFAVTSGNGPWRPRRSSLLPTPRRGSHGPLTHCFVFHIPKGKTACDLGNSVLRRNTISPTFQSSTAVGTKLFLTRWGLPVKRNVNEALIPFLPVLADNDFSVDAPKVAVPQVWMSKLLTAPRSWPRPNRPSNFDLLTPLNGRGRSRHCTTQPRRTRNCLTVSRHWREATPSQRSLSQHPSDPRAIRAPARQRRPR